MFLLFKRDRLYFRMNVKKFSNYICDGEKAQYSILKRGIGDPASKSSQVISKRRLTY